MKDLPQLPVGWAWVRLDDLATLLRNGISIKPDAENGVPVLRISSVRAGRVNLCDVRYILADKSEFDPFTVVRDDILFTRYNGTRELVGVAACMPDVQGRLLHPDKLIKVRVPLEQCAPRFVAWAANVGASRRFIEGRIRTTAGQAGISGGDLRQLPLPLAPRAEQDRIVAVIEQHLSDIDAGVASLERVLANLKRYRAAVLKAACEGRLVPTEAELARKEGREHEPGDVLLRRILHERRARWEAEQLAKMKARGQVPRDDRWMARYEEPEGPDASDLPKLPEGWAWAKLGSVADVQLGQQRAPVHAAAEVTYPYVRAANITWRGLDLSDVKQMGFPDPERYRLAPGDVLLSEASGSPSEVGKPAIWRGEIPGCCYQKTLLRVRSYCPDLASEWLHLGFMRDALLGRFAKMAPGVGILHLTAERMLEWSVAIAPIAEQRRILTEVARLQSITDEMEQGVNVQLARARRLRQSVLKSAFEGKLVPQDPNDEPASALLDRIRAARAEASAANGAGRTSRRRRAKVLEADEGGLDDG